VSREVPGAIGRLPRPVRHLAARLFQLRAGEGELALLGSALFLLVQAGQVFSVNAGDALLFDRFGVEALPYLFILGGAATLIVTTAYAAVLGRPDRNRISLSILVGLALVTVLGWAATFLAGPAIYPALWLVIALVNGVVGTMIWVLAGEFCDARQAKRLFAVFASAGILGGVAAGFLTGPAARALGTQTLLLVFAILLLLAAAVARSLIRRHARISARPTVGRSPMQQLRRAHHLVLSNPTMRLTAVGAILFSILFFTVAFPFNVQVASAFPDEADLAGFLGAFGGIVTAVTFAVSLLLAGRVLARIGVTNTLLLLPLAYLGGFVLWTVRFDLPTAVLVRFVQLVLLGGLAGTAFNALFNVVPADQRSQVRAYQAGPPAQLGVMLSGILILLGQRGLTPGQALAMGVLVSAACSIVVWRMRRSYGESLVEALSQGVSEVFTETEARFELVRNDAQARGVAERGLNDPRPAVRRLSLQILVRLQAADSAALIAARRTDESPEVRLAAIEALDLIPLQGVAGEARSFLEDAEPRVRAAALRILARHRLIPREGLEALLADPSPSVRARAAIALAQAGESSRAAAIIESLLAASSLGERLAGLEAYPEVEGLVATANLIETLKSSPRELRLAAARALGSHPTREGIEALLAVLDDPDPQVRRAAGQALGSSEEAVDDLIAALGAGTPRAQSEVVSALAGRGSAARAALIDWAAGQIPEAERLRRWRSALSDSPVPHGSPPGPRGLPPGLPSKAAGTPRGLPPGFSSKAARWLGELLGRYEWMTEQRILGGLASAGSPQAMEAVARGLLSEDADLRSQAVEALDTVGERRVTRGLLRLLEADYSTGRPASVVEVLHEVARHPRPWFRALALRASTDILRDEWFKVAQLAAADDDPIVRQAAQLDGSPGPGGDMIETSPTLGVVERVLFLREVPIFGRLEPEDLERIGALAGERIYHAGEFLCREGDPGEELFVLVEGSVEVEKETEGATRTLRTLATGDHLGELAILRNQPRSASVRALSSVRALVLESESLRSILTERPEVCLAMLESLAERMSTLG